MTKKLLSDLGPYLFLLFWTPRNCPKCHQNQFGQ